MKDNSNCKDDFFARLERLFLVSVISVLLSFTLGGCISFGGTSEEKLHCVIEDENLKQNKGYDCVLKMDVYIKSQYVQDNILTDNLCNGRIALYKIVSGSEEQVGSDFYVTNLEAVDKNKLTFSVVYAGVKGKRVEVPGCRLVRQRGNAAIVSLGEEWPFAEKEYRASVMEDRIFSPDDIESKDTWHGFSLEKPYAADRYMYNLYSEYAWVFVMIFLLAVVFFVWHGAYSNLGMLCLTGAICFVSVTHDWTLAFPMVIPFFVALVFLFIPYINTISLYVFGFGVLASFIPTIGVLWHDCGFFLFVWKLLYIGFCTLWAVFAAVGVFSGRCDKCGSFFVGNCRRRKEYYAAKDVLSIPLNSDGLMADDPVSLINGYNEKKDESETCYWCTND